MKTKSNLKTSVKRLACGMLSAILLIPASAFAADTVTVESPVIDILASTNAAEHPENSLYTIATTTGSDSITVDNEVYTPNITSGDWGVVNHLLADNTELNTALGYDENTGTYGKDKIVLEFDIKTWDNSNLGEGYNTWHLRKDENGDTKDSMLVWPGHLKFNSTDITWENGLSNDYYITNGLWYNVKHVSYLNKKDSKQVVEWYVNGNLVRRGERTTDYGTKLTKLIVQARYATSNNFYSYKNLKVYAADDVEKDNTQVAKKTNTVLSAKAAEFTEANTGEMKLDNNYIKLNTNTTAAKDGFTRTQSGSLVNVTRGNMLDGTKPYSIKFDVYMPKCDGIADGAKMQGLSFLATPPADDASKAYFGRMDVRAGQLRFKNELAWSLTTDDQTVLVSKDAWHTVECVIEPATETDTNIYMTWYVDGKVALNRSALETGGTYTSTTGLLTSFYLISHEGIYAADDTEKSNNLNSPIKIDNIEICTQSYAHPDFALQPTLSQSGQNLIVSLNKAAESDIVLKNLIVKDESDETVAPTGITVAEDKMSATIALPAASNSQWYTVELPERMISADGYSLSETQISTPHLEITAGELVTRDSNTSVDISYTNTTGDTVNGMVILAEYDGERCVGVDIRNVTFGKAETATSVAAGSLPSLTTNGSHTYRAYVWKANTIAPLSGAIVAK